MKKRESTQHTVTSQKTDGAVSKLRAFHLLLISLLVLVCLIVYFNSLSNEFVFDDFGTIVENKYLQHPGEFLASLFNHSYFQIAGLEASYRPIATLFYFLIYSIGGLDPLYYHLANLVLHILNAILVYWMANLILRNPLGALIAALLFACHPALSEAVNCISYNEDLLTTFFFLISLIFYIRLESENFASNIRNYALTLLFYFFGLLSKEMAITLPVIILLYDLTLRDADARPSALNHVLITLQKRKFYYSGYIGVSLVYLYIRFFILAGPKAFLKPDSGGLFERIIFLPGHIFSFIRLAIFPKNLTADYVFSYPNSFFDSMNLLGCVIVIGLAGASFIIYRYSKEIFFGLWWFLITLFPVSNLIVIYHPFAERYLYLPSIGFCLIIPIVVNALARRGSSNPATANMIMLIPIIVILGLYSAATISRNRVWQSNFTLWSATVESSPASSVAHGGLGMAYLDRKMLDQARKEFEIAIQLRPKDHKSYYNLGLVYYQKGDWTKAVENFKRSVAINAESVRAHYNLGTLYAMRGLIDLAVKHFARVTELDPENSEAHYNLGVAYARQGKLDQAISEWEKVLQLDPHHRSAGNNLKKAQAIKNNSERPN